MSYDINIGNRDFNYTYNVAGMWCDLYPDDGIRIIYGLSGEESIPVLRELRTHMEDNAGRMRDMEPANGWGSFEGAVEFIGKLILAAIDNKDEIWEGD